MAKRTKKPTPEGDQRDPTSITLELEDHLQQFNFHTNGFDPSKPSSLGAAYGVLHYDRIGEAFRAKPDVRLWRIAADVRDGFFKSTGSPTFRLLALEIRRLAKSYEAEATT